MKHFFLDRYKELGKNIVPSIIDKQYIRVNTLLIKEAHLLNRLRKKGIKLQKQNYLDFCYETLPGEFSIGATPEYLQGYYYVQDIVAQLPVQVLDPKPGELILDMSAAPGGKTTQMAQYMQNKGQIIALDVISERIKALKNNLQRCGVCSCIVYNKDARYCDDLGLEFDKILLDAPCSGNFATDENWFNKRELEGILSNAKLQKQMIAAAIKVLKKGGILVYSTCSLEPEENELIIDWALNKFDVKLVDIGLKAGEKGLTSVFGQQLNQDIAKCIRFWPNETQGFFIAKIVK